VDFESVPADLDDEVLAFVRALHAALAEHGALTTQALGTDIDDSWLRRYGAVNDDVILMLYDEHYGSGDAGPVASQTWYADRVRHAFQVLDPAHTILAIGAYGYDWNDAGPDASGGELTFQDVMAAARDHAARIGFDPVALNPWITWTDPDSTDHIAWYLDAVTAYNQSLAGDAAGARGRAVWRLGSEDPALWRVIGRRPNEPPGTGLATIPPGYDVEFDGDGEILRLTARPTSGRRAITVDSASGLVRREEVTAYPSPWVVHRYGRSAHRVALTFDVSGGETQLQAIQKSLDAAGVKASFFVTGRWASDHPSLLQALSAAGHSVEASGFDYSSMVGLNADQVNSRLAAVRDSFARAGVPAARFFRPPSGRFDDALLEGALFRGLIPVTWAVDSQDWRLDSSDAIVRAVTAGVGPGAIILLHADDSCRGTAAAIPELIRLLQERGLAPVTLRELLGNEEGGD
jgi:peptidoglycan/xylan/chitin deacetylase (PgdA/CDA1 family)